MPKVKAIFFDLDETLVENRRSVTEIFRSIYTDFGHELGPNKQREFFSTLGEYAKDVWANMFTRELSPERQLVECFQYSIAATNSVEPKRHRALARDMLDHFLHLSWDNVSYQDNAEAVLEELKDRGIITGIITNGIEQVQLGKIHQLGLDDLVDYVNVSAQARAHKPLPPIFEQALSNAKVAAKHSWMIGDHPTNDVAGGIRAGLTGIYYNPKQHELDRAFANLDERPDHIIRSLADVFTILD